MSRRCIGEWLADSLHIIHGSMSIDTETNARLAGESIIFAPCLLLLGNSRYVDTMIRVSKHESVAKITRNHKDSRAELVI